MTEQAAQRQAGKRGPRASTVMLTTLAAFLAVLAFLAFQVRAGKDPALSSSGQVAQVQTAQPRRVIVRKVEDDYVITKVIPAPRSGSSAQPALTTGASGGGSAPVQSSPAPVVSNPAPAPAPAPAAPAPVTRTS
jgi:hypothetical protein